MKGFFYRAFSRLAPYVVNKFYPLIHVAYGLYRSFYTSPGRVWKQNDSKSLKHLKEGILINDV